MTRGGLRPLLAMTVGPVFLPLIFRGPRGSAARDDRQLWLQLRCGERHGPHQPLGNVKAELAVVQRRTAIEPEGVEHRRGRGQVGEEDLGHRGDQFGAALFGRTVIRRLPDLRMVAGDRWAEVLPSPAQVGVVDLSLAPTPNVGDSVGEILKLLGVDAIGAPGSTAIVALLNDAVKKGGSFASQSVGGLSGAFIPVCEDQELADAVKDGSLVLEKLEAMTSVCSVGLDMIAVPGSVDAGTIAAIIADEMVIGMINGKTTAVRLIPAPGKGPGDMAPVNATRNEKEKINQNSDRKLINSLYMFQPIPFFQ